MQRAEAGRDGSEKWMAKRISDAAFSRGKRECVVQLTILLEQGNGTSE